MNLADVPSGIAAMNNRCPFEARGVNVLGIHMKIDSMFMLCAAFQPCAANLMFEDEPRELIAVVTPESLPAIFAGEIQPNWLFDDEFDDEYSSRTRTDE